MQYDQGDGQLHQELAEKDSKRKKKNNAKKTEDCIVRRFAKNGLIDKDKVKAARKSSSKHKKKKKKGVSSSSSSYSVHILTPPPLAQTSPAIRTAPRAMARRTNQG